MAINLPNNVSVGQKIFTSAGINYEWDGTAWVVATADASNYIVTQITALVDPGVAVEFEKFRFRWGAGTGGTPFQIATVTGTETVNIANDFISGTIVVGQRESNRTITTTFVNTTAFTPGFNGAKLQSIISAFDGTYSYRIVSSRAGTKRIISVQKLY
jgi:hypothetical protein